MKNFETREGQLEYIILSLNEAQTIFVERIKDLENQLEEQKDKTKRALGLVDLLEMQNDERMEQAD